MKLADLHCDTPLKMYQQKCSLHQNSRLHISLDKAKNYEAYLQCAAIWSDEHFSDENSYALFLKAAENFHRQAGTLAKTAPDDTGTSLILTVEDGRMLAGNLSRLNTLYEAGVRILTLVWKGESCIGGGWDTDAGLTEFGREVVTACFDRGILVDISHGSDVLIGEVLDLAETAGKPILATHSNFRAICPHRRNLTDDLYRRILSAGGITGVSLCTFHLNESPVACADDVLLHMEHAIRLGGEDALCLGCDFDGINPTPADITDLSSMEYLYTCAARRFGTALADKIFFDNAYQFLQKNL